MVGTFAVVSVILIFLLSHVFTSYNVTSLIQLLYKTVIYSHGINNYKAL